MTIGAFYLSPKDAGKFCKKTGRKISMTTALSYLYPHSFHYEKLKRNRLLPSIEDPIEANSNKYCRTMFWNQLLKECKY